MAVSLAMTDLERLFLAVEGQALDDRRRLAVLALIDEVCNERERQVLRWRYVEEPRKTLAECAKELHVTRERIRQMELKGIRRLQRAHLRFRRLYGLCETALPHRDADDRAIPALSVNELELSVRTMNCLRNANIKTIGELCQQSPRDLLRLRNFGRKCLREVTGQLAALRLRLNGQVCETCLTPMALTADGGGWEPTWETR